MSADQRAVASSSCSPVRRRHALDLGADLVHRPASDAGVDQRLRGLRAVLLVQRDGGLELGELLADQVVEAPERVALRRGAVLHQHLAQAVERAVDLGHRRGIGGEILLLAREQIAALPGLGVDDQRQGLVQRRLHLERNRHLAVGELEAAVAQLRVDGDRERRDDAEHERQDDTGRECRFHVCGQCRTPRANYIRSAVAPQAVGVRPTAKSAFGLLRSPPPRVRMRSGCLRATPISPLRSRKFRSGLGRRGNAASFFAGRLRKVGQRGTCDVSTRACCGASAPPSFSQSSICLRGLAGCAMCVRKALHGPRRRGQRDGGHELVHVASPSEFIATATGPCRATATSDCCRARPWALSCSSSAGVRSPLGALAAVSFAVSLSGSGVARMSDGSGGSGTSGAFVAGGAIGVVTLDWAKGPAGSSVLLQRGRGECGGECESDGKRGLHRRAPSNGSIAH